MSAIPFKISDLIICSLLKRQSIDLIYLILRIIIYPVIYSNGNVFFLFREHILIYIMGETCSACNAKELTANEINIEEEDNMSQN